MTAPAAEEHEHAALLVEHLDIVEGRIDHVNDALRVDGDVLGPDEGPGGVADPPGRLEQLPHGIELLKPALDDIDHPDVAFPVNIHAQWADELPVLAPHPADRPQLLTGLPVQDQHAECVEVGHIELVAADGDPRGLEPLVAERRGVALLLVEDEDHAPLQVGDVDHPVIGDGHVRRLGQAAEAPRAEHARLPLPEIEHGDGPVAGVADVDPAVVHLHAVGLADAQHLCVIAEDELLQPALGQLDVGAEAVGRQELDVRLGGKLGPERVGPRRVVGAGPRRAGAAGERLSRSRAASSACRGRPCPHVSGGPSGRGRDGGAVYWPCGDPGSERAPRSVASNQGDDAALRGAASAKTSAAGPTPGSGPTAGVSPRGVT